MSNAKEGSARLPTESAIARLFVDRFAKRIRIVNDQGVWLIRRKQRWMPDRHRKIESMARRFIDKINANEDTRLGSRNTVRAVVDLARTDGRISVLAEELDCDPDILGTPAGPVQLRTGKLVKLGNRLVTKSTSVTPDFDAEHPRWTKFLAEITQGDRDLSAYLQRWAGYMLTGDTRDEAVLVLHGSGQNGKSIWLKTVAAIMGDYHRTASKNTFIASRYQTHMAELAFLRGARMVSLSETDPGQSWAEATLKMAVSGEPITAREMRQNAFMFRPIFKLAAATNHLPRLKSADDAMKRRLKIVAFNFKAKRRNLDLLDELAEEAPAILAWMIRGAQMWYRKRLADPASVIAATEDYVAMYDPFAGWFDKSVTEAPQQFTPTKLLTKSFNEYAAERELTPTSEIELGRQLKALGYRPLHRHSTILGRRARGFEGIRLL